MQFTLGHFNVSITFKLLVPNGKHSQQHLGVTRKCLEKIDGNAYHWFDFSISQALKKFPKRNVL
jgi:hypothetical protein